MFNTFLLYLQKNYKTTPRYQTLIINMSCESYPQPEYQEKDLTSSDKTSNLQDHDANSSPEYLELNEISQVEQIINQGTDEEFQKIVPEIPVKLNNLSYKCLISNKMLHHRLIKLFYKVIKSPKIQKESQEYPLFLLSLLAELIRYNPSIKLTFTKKIVISMLSVNIESIQGLKQASKIIQILSILMGNMCQQGRLMMRLGVVDQLWKSLALLYSKTDDLFALRILLKAFLDISSTTQLTLSSQDVTVRVILTKVSQIFGIEKANKLKMMLLRPKSKCLSQATLWELVTKRK